MKCSLNPQNIPGGHGELIHKWYEEDLPYEEIVAKAKTVGVVVTKSSVGRHRTDHLHRLQGEALEIKKRSDLEVLELMIARGSEQVALDSTTISAEQLLRAMELKLKLTQGSVHDHMYNAMREAMSGTDLDAEYADLPDEAPEAIRGLGEREQEATDDA